MKSLNHKNIVRFIDSSDNLDDQIFFIVMELCDCNLLEYTYKMTKGDGFSEKESLKNTASILNGK
jgi:serine/threonine protein kinase